MHERTEIVETPVGREVTEVSTTTAPAAAVDRSEAVAYDPYAHRRQTAYRVNQFVWLVVGFVEALLAIRFVLKLLGANPNAGFAEFIYGITAPLVAPFVGLFGTPAANGSVLELHSLIAMVVYGLVGWVIAKLVWIMMGETRSAVTTSATSIDTHS